MSLDLSETAIQLDGMALDLRARQGDRELRLERALEALDAFDVNSYRGRLEESASTLAWSLPTPVDGSGERVRQSALPDDFCVVAVDGSHIDVDRHIPARCFLINIGVTVLTYGSRSDARLWSRPRLYARQDELVLRDPAASYREQAIEGVVLGAKRMVEEVMALVEVVRELPADTPTLALMDGSLIMLGLTGRGYDDFVLKELIEEGLVRALDELREMARSRTIAVASYISLPRSAEVVNSLRLAVCPYDIADCGRHCGTITPGDRPCDSSSQGLMDRDLYSSLLEPEERSSVFASSSRLVESFYRGQRVHFFYVNGGEEIGRVEVPSWVTEDNKLLSLVHSGIVYQCRRGPGYPIALMEAHEQAVVTASDRRHFAQLVESALVGQRVPVYSSEKSRSKRLRWI